MHMSLELTEGLVQLFTCMTHRGRNVNYYVGEDSCSSKTMKEGSESILLVAIVTLWSQFVPQK